MAKKTAKGGKKKGGEEALEAARRSRGCRAWTPPFFDAHLRIADFALAE